MTKTLVTFITRAEDAQRLQKELRTKLADITAAKEAVINDVGLSEQAALDKASELAAQQSVILRRIERAEGAYNAASVAAMNEAQQLGRRVGKLVQNHWQGILARLDKALAPFYPEQRDRSRAVTLLRGQATPPELYQAQKLNHINPDQVYDGDALAYAKSTFSSATRAITTLNLK